MNVELNVLMMDYAMLLVLAKQPLLIRTLCKDLRMDGRLINASRNTFSQEMRLGIMITLFIIQNKNDNYRFGF